MPSLAELEAEGNRSILHRVRHIRVIKYLESFISLEAWAGLILMAVTVITLVIANSTLAPRYTSLLNIPFSVTIGSVGIAKPLLLWINDGLMALFFFVVGLELKREILEGHLSTLARASLPAIAALGGMVGPAAIYLVLNRGDDAAMRGWAIPAATDIAFALGVLALLGNRVPPALKAFLLSIAIFDDLGAIVIIALFYTSKLSMSSLLLAAALLIVLVVMNRLGVRRTAPHFLIGIALWVAVLKSGIHATLAGVTLAMFIPLEGGPEGEESPLKKLEHGLHPWVAFGVLPIFAFANAGVPLTDLRLGDALHPVPLGIMLGLFLGKQIGIFASCWLAAKLGIASRPVGVGWLQLYGAAILCGIGFTMSLFIAALAFEGEVTNFQGLERLGILLGSLASGIIGYVVLRVALSSTADTTSPASHHLEPEPGQ